MIGYMIKFTQDCPHSELKNTYFGGKTARGDHNFLIFDTFRSAERKLRRLKYKKWAKIIEFDMRPTTEWVPTEHFYDTPKGLFYPEREVT